MLIPLVRTRKFYVKNMESSVNVHEIVNLCTEDERKFLIKTLKPLLINGIDLAKQLGRKKRFPGYQTLANLHKNKDFDFLHEKLLEQIEYHLDLRLKVDRSWGLSTQGHDRDSNWHNHEGIPWSAVYYLKTVKHLNNGTQFRDGFIEADPGSVLVFPGNLDHASPIYEVRHDRIVIAFDLLYE